MLTDAEIVKIRNEYYAEGVPYDNDDPRVCLKKMADDLQQTRQDLRGSLKSIVEFGGPHVQEEARRLLEQYGWEGDT